MRTLEERLADARAVDRDRTPVEAAQLLLQLVAHLDDHDRLTRGHSERVRAYAQSIGRELGLGRRELDLLNWAALLHDVGKLEVPHDVLTKQGQPTPEEWELLRRHPEAGAELAAPLRDWLGEWGDAIEQHHERWDGAGYPHGLAATEISLAGRIVAVADVYDVITSSRSYKRAGSAAAARQELARCAGTQFDPTIVRAFLSMSVRSRRIVTGPLSWLAHAPVLARVPLGPAAGVVSAAAVATGVAVAPLPAPAGRPAVAQIVAVAGPASPAPAASSAPEPGVLVRSSSSFPRGADPAPTSPRSRSHAKRTHPQASAPHRGAVPDASSGARSDPSPPSTPPSPAPETPEPPHTAAATPASAPAPPALAASKSLASPPPPPPVDVPAPPEVVKPVEDVVQPVVEGVVQPVVEDVVQPVLGGTVQPVVSGVMQPVVDGAVPPVETVVSELPVVGQLLPRGSSKTKPAPLLQLP